MEEEDSQNAMATETTDNATSLPKTLTTIRTARPPATTPEAESEESEQVEESQPDMEVATDIIASLSEVIPTALRKADTAISTSGIPCQNLYEVLEVGQAEGTVSENEEQVAATMAHALSLPTSAESPTEAVRKETFWGRVKEVMSSRNSDIILKEKLDRIKKVLQSEGKGVDEPPRFLFYIRQRQFSLKRAPEFGWLDDVVCEPTKEEDTSSKSLLSNWRRVAAAEEIYDILKEVHEDRVPHQNYRNTYIAVSKKYARIPRHICKDFVFSCSSCLTKKDKTGVSFNNEDGTPKRPLKRQIMSPATPVRPLKMSTQCKVKLENFKLKGLIAAPFTPFAENGDLDIKSISKYIEVLVQDGVDSVFVLGTTGEGMSLTLKERKALANEWVKSGRRKLDHVIVQVGTYNLKDTQDLALHAASIGASAIAVLPPVYFKPQTPEHLVNYLKQVGSIVPSTPLLYYHIPMMAGIDFSMMDILRALELDPIPSFKGAKFATDDLTDFSLSVNVAKDKYQMIYAMDGMMLPSMILGGDAYIGATFNFAGKVFSRMIEAFNTGDLERARAEQFRIHAFLDVMNRYEKIAGLATIKYTMSLAKLDVGPPRPPQSQMSLEDVEGLRKDLSEIGFFDWIN